MEEAERYLESFFDVTPEKAEPCVREPHNAAPCTARADVYISIPFCRARCAYCSFPGEAGRVGASPVSGEALLMERWALLRARGQRHGRGDFARATGRGGRRPPRCTGVHREGGPPDTITRGKLLALKRLGIGHQHQPQTMNDETLRLIGRDHTARQTYEGLCAGGGAGI